MKLFAEIYKSKLTDTYFLIAKRKINNLISLEISNFVLEKLLNPAKTICIESLYKTMVNYQDFDKSPFGVLRSSAVSDKEVEGISTGDLRYTSGIGSLCSAFLSVSEMQNLKCILYVNVIDQY